MMDLLFVQGSTRVLVGRRVSPIDLRQIGKESTQSIRRHMSTEV